jgi:osmotically-inducible protein OsmY
MRPRRMVSSVLIAVATAVACGSAVCGQEAGRPARTVLQGGAQPRYNGANSSAAATPQPSAGTAAIRPDVMLAVALRSNPMTAPYPIAISLQKGVVVLSGRVGTKPVHDAAVRMAVDSGVRFRDDLVIDTGMAHLAANGGIAVSPAAAVARGNLASPPYIYPPPLMGRLDDPFFGFVPPLLSFPPWWRRNQPGDVMVAPRRDPAAAASATAAAGPKASSIAPNATDRGGWQPLEVDPVLGQVEVSVDVAGQVFLRGSVVSEEAAREIIAAARSVPGVTRVESQLSVVPRRAEQTDLPPPPPAPEPMVEPNAPADDRLKPPVPDAARPKPAVPTPPRTSPVPTAPAALDSHELTERVVGTLRRRPGSAELPVKVRSTGATVTLSGKVPTVYEAMLVYRAAQQTPGVTDVVDVLEFAVPDENNANPLVRLGQAEDVEPYLAAQIRRHIGELARLDRIRARGGLIELRGKLLQPGDHERLLATLRSIPILHGFRLEPEFSAE